LATQCVAFLKPGNASTRTGETTQKTEERILKLIAENPTVSRTEISEKLGDITANGVKYQLKKLQKKDILKRIGADKGGHWEIVNWGS